MDFKKLLQISDFTKHFLKMFSTKEVLSRKVDRATFNAAETTHYCGTGEKETAELSSSEGRQPMR